MLWQIYNICPFNFLFAFGEIPNMVSLWLGKRQGNNLTRLRSNLARPFGDQAKGFLWVPVCWGSFSHLVAQSMFCFWRSPVSSLPMGSLPRKRALSSAQVPSTTTSIMVIHSQSFLYKSLLPMVLKGVSIYLSCTQSIPSFNEMIALYISNHGTFNSLG